MEKFKMKNVIKFPYLDLVHNDSFFHVLRYMYTGQLVLYYQDVDRIFDLMSIAKTLQLENMSEEMSQMLTKSLTLENVALIYEKASIYDQTELKLRCETLIDQNVELLVKKLGEIVRPVLERNNRQRKL